MTLPGAVGGVMSLVVAETTVERRLGLPAVSVATT